MYKVKNYVLEIFFNSSWCMKLCFRGEKQKEKRTGPSFGEKKWDDCFFEKRNRMMYGHTYNGSF